MGTRIKPETPTEENPEWTRADFARARKGSEVLAELGIPLPVVKNGPAAKGVVFKKKPSGSAEQPVLQARWEIKAAASKGMVNRDAAGRIIGSGRKGATKKKRPA